MPAFFGALTVDPHEVSYEGDPSAFRLLPEQRVDVHDLGPLRIVSVERRGEAARLATCPRTGAVLLLKGILDEEPGPAPASETAARPGGPARRGRPESELAARLLATVAKDGREALVGLPGHYVAILWEPDLERLSLMTDALGLYPVYSASEGPTFLFGTQARHFARARAFRLEPDLRSVVELLRVEHVLEDHTLYRRVRLVPPGSLVEVHRGGVPRARRIRDPFAERDRAPGDLDEAAAALGRAYDRAFAPLAGRGRLIIPLSGGKDSRTVLCEATRARGGSGVGIEALSLGAPEHWDARCARRIADVLGMPWRLIPVDPTLHDRLLEPFVSLTEGTASVFGAWWAAIVEALEPVDVLPGETTIATGFLGDALSGGHLRFFHPDFDQRRAHLPDDPGIERLLRRLGRRSFASETLRDLLRPEIAGAWLDMPERTLRDSYFELASAPRHVRMIRTDVVHRQRRFIASQLHLYRQRHRPAAPLAHPSVVRVFLSLGEDELRHQRAYTRALASRHPAAARIMEARTRAPCSGGLYERARCRIERALVDARDRVRARIGDGARPERNFFSFDHRYGEDLATALEPLDGIFRPDRLAAFVRAEPSTSNRLRILHTLREWLRRAEADRADTAARRAGRAA